MPILFTVALAPPLAAQVVRLRGTVTDENGVPVEAVKISITAAGAAATIAYSNQAGRFQVSVKAPGEYAVTLTKPGYFRIANQVIRLQKGNNEAAFTLSHEFEVHEKVEVRSPANQIEPEQIAQQEILHAQDILNIPVHSTHDLRTYLPALPSAVRDNSGTIHVAGGGSAQTEYLLDGFEIGDPATGELSSHLSVDSVRAVEVTSGRYGSQYGHAGSGVMEIDTDSGDDRWRFGATDFIPGPKLQQGFHIGNWYPRFKFSGPLVKGRMWFSDGISIQRTFTLISELPRGANTGQQWSGDNLFRVQVNLTPANILQGNFLYNLESDSHLGLGAFSPLSTTTNVHAHQTFVAVKDQIFFGRHALELGAAGDEGVSNSAPLGTQPYVLNPFSASGNYFQQLQQRTRRIQGIGNLTLASLEWQGSHTIQAGFNVDGLALSQRSTRSPIVTLRADGTLLLHTIFSGAPMFRVTNTQTGYYVQDSWQIVRPLFLEIGGRTDWDRITGAALWAPRVGLNWLPFHEDRSKLSLGWGIYYQPITLGLLGQGLDQQRSDVLFDPGGAVIGSGATRFVLPEAGLRPQRFNTTTAAWTQRLRTNTFAGAQFTYRVEGDGLTYEDVQMQPLGGLFVLQNSRHDHYRALEVWGRHVFTNKAEVYGAYTRSRAETNSPLDYSLIAPLFAPQAAGPLPWDTPNRLISWGWTPLPIWQLLLSYHVEYRSGFPFNAVNQLGQLEGRPDEHRFPGYLSLDIGLEKRFPFHGRIWAVRLSVINVTDHSNPDTVNTKLAPFLFAGGQRRAFTARIRLVGRKLGGRTGKD